MRRIKVRTLINAIRKDGYPKVQGEYSRRVSPTEMGYCAFGQAGRNLRISPSTLHTATTNLNYYLSSAILRLNDSTNKTMPEIADALEAEYNRYLDDFIVIPS